MSDPSSTGLTIASAAANVTSTVATNELRFLGDKLQQCWAITEFKGGVVSAHWLQWRDVPSVPADAPEARDTEQYIHPHPMARP